MRVRRGSWEPLLPGRWRTAVVGIIPITPVIIGIDYLMGENGRTLLEVERAAPISVCGWGLLLCGAVTLAGFVGRWRHVAIIGLWCSGALMLTLGVGIGAETIAWLGGGGFRGPWLYGAIGLASCGSALGYAFQVEVKDGD